VLPDDIRCAYIGTMVSSDSTSKLTRMSSSEVVNWPRTCTKCREYCTLDAGRWIIGRSILCKYLASWCVGQPVALIIGRKETPYL
jgi:hypothetical protein